LHVLTRVTRRTVRDVNARRPSQLTVQSSPNPSATSP